MTTEEIIHAIKGRFGSETSLPIKDAMIDMARRLAALEQQVGACPFDRCIASAAPTPKTRTRGEEVAEQVIQDAGFKVVIDNLDSSLAMAIDGEGFRGMATPVERLRRWLASLLDSEIAKARAEQREADAKVAESKRGKGGSYDYAVDDIAAAIRNRGEERK